MLRAVISALWLAFTIVAGAIVAPFVEPFVQTRLNAAGYYDEFPMTALAWVSGLSSAAWFPWLAGVAIGLFAGVWVARMAIRIDRKPSKHKIAAQACEIAANTIKNFLHHRQFTNRPPTSEIDISRQCFVANAKLKALRVKVPDLSSVRGRDSEYDAMLSYYAHLSALIETGDIISARNIAQKLVDPIVIAGS